MTTFIDKLYNGYYNKNRYTYPTILGYTYYYVYKEGKVICEGIQEQIEESLDMSLHDIQKSYTVEKTVNEKAYQEHLKVYNTGKSKKEQEFKIDALKECGYDILPNPVQDALYSYAWQEGHSGGFPEVYIALCDLSDIVNAFLDHMAVNIGHV